MLFSSGFAIIESDMGMYEVPLPISLLGFGMGAMLANFHIICGIMLVLRAVFNILERNASPRGPMCFKCLMFSLLGPCELLLLLSFIVDVISLYFVCLSVNGSIWLVCCVFNGVCELFGCYFVVEYYGSV